MRAARTAGGELLLGLEGIDWRMERMVAEPDVERAERLQPLHAADEALRPFRAVVQSDAARDHRAIGAVAVAHGKDDGGCPGSVSRPHVEAEGLPADRQRLAVLQHDVALQALHRRAAAS